MQPSNPFVDIVGNTSAQLTMSTAGTANTGPLSSLPSIYGLWALTQDAYVAINPQGPASSTPLTLATGYLVKNGQQPVPVKIPPYGSMVAVSSSSGILQYERIGGY